MNQSPSLGQESVPPARRVHLQDILVPFLRGLPHIGKAARGLFLLAYITPERKLSIGALIERWAQRRPQQVALRDGDRDISYAELNRRANQWARRLQRAGVERGDRVGILLENRAEVLIAVAATVKLGAIAGMLNHHQRGDVLRHSLGLIEPRALVVGDECLPVMDSVKSALPQHLRENLFWLADGVGRCPDGMHALVEESAQGSGDNLPQTARLPSHAPAFYIFTSGTTGLPKAAVMSHRRWLRAMAGLGTASMHMRGDDVLYCALPLYHNNALTVSWSAVLGAGATLAIGRKFSASRFWQEIARNRATAFCYIGELCRYLLAQPPSDAERLHRLRICVGNGLRPELWREFRERFNIPRINEFYGASECNLVFTNTFNIEGSCGFCPLPFEVVAYDVDSDQPRRDTNGRLLPVAVGESGLLLAKVTEQSPFDGYTTQEDSERKLLRNALEDGDCWFNTGDLVRKLGYGHIQFVDRTGDTFRWKGENVATTEVEAVFDAFSQIEQSVVYGVQVPHMDGRAGMAAVTLAVPAEQLDVVALAAHLRAALPGYAVPPFLRLRRALDTTTTFKTRRVELREEGYADNGEPVLLLAAEDDRYRPLTDELRARIGRGELRL